MSHPENVYSWGRLKKVNHPVFSQNWTHSNLPQLEPSMTLLPFGEGRSYGDSCLNAGGALLNMRNLNRFIHFDKQNGILRCEAGVRLDEILALTLPEGWFIPVSPGTQFITLGGAISNDIHGKNHHCAGTFGRHVNRFELLRSNQERLICSATENTDLFNATIGGLGLTGVILWAEIRLKAVYGPLIDCETVKFSNLEEFFELSRNSETDFDYSVAWLDTLASGKKLGRGHFIRGNHSKHHPNKLEVARSGFLSVPCDAPDWLLNNLTIRSFNSFYYHRLLPKVSTKTVHYQPFFYPLDKLRHWNRLYGKRGFYQFQLVLPPDKSQRIHDVIQLISSFKAPSFLGVLKVFGNLESPGLLSFPKPGVTLALDFPNRGSETLELMQKLHEFTKEQGGRVYPAKDMTMTPKDFQNYYPNWKEFSRFVDPLFSSSFWRRVTQGDS